MVIPNYLHQNVVDRSDDKQKCSSVSLLVAIGMNGDAVVLSVAEGPNTLVDDIQSIDAKMVFRPCMLPKKTGIYRFTGNLVCDGVGENQHDLSSEFIRNGSFERIYVATQLNTIR